MTQKFYAGIGSRRTPEGILALMTAIASMLRADGYILRSGNAEGADQAFAVGAGYDAHVFLPWPSFNRDWLAETYPADRPGPTVITDPEPWTAQYAEEFHPAWERCTQGARKLHSRNVHQLHGLQGEPLSSFVICWTPDAAEVGGTATAIRMARHSGVPVFNLADAGTRERLERYAMRAVTV